MALTPPYVVRVIASVFQVLGLILTAFRIYFRLKIGRFWWEDAWAAVSLLLGSVWMIAEWTFLLTSECKHPFDRGPKPPVYRTCRSSLARWFSFHSSLLDIHHCIHLYHHVGIHFSVVFAALPYTTHSARCA
ncbi:hypothetical protein PAXRUDRAFT_514950 [Paxillus rubicundulus Ve08.2h10]|uniref:Uncharacterized protein n=1 Tax=Paxillus rubicundulus Ve08.2h10 TaxID=930991 RepID=A0A0D0CV45_9AGAM|nr:hypothetical protein PAXRUDRAFT_514950 [Paxillus rubicundulus Ve08.2h10]